jgi:hypothetical protein
MLDDIIESGDIVKVTVSRYFDIYKVGIVLYTYNDGFDAVVLLDDGSQIADRQIHFEKL